MDLVKELAALEDTRNQVEDERFFGSNRGIA